MGLLCCQLLQELADADAQLLLVLLHPSVQLLQCGCGSARLDVATIHAPTQLLQVGAQARQHISHMDCLLHLLAGVGMAIFGQRPQCRYNLRPAAGTAGLSHSECVCRCCCSHCCTWWLC
jgi:hypothetical protein